MIKAKDYIINSLIVVFTLIMAFCVLEIFFRVKVNLDSAWSTVVNLPIFAESEYRSWDLKPNAVANHGFGSPTPVVKIDSIWLRDDEIPEKKDVKRIMLLGDSFVFGMWAQTSDTISYILNNTYIWPKYTKVINAWVIGQTIDDAYLYLKNDWIKLKPDIVVFNFFVWNDITELKRHDQTFDDKWDLIRVIDKEHYVNEEGYLRRKWRTMPRSFLLYWIETKLWLIKYDSALTWPIFFEDGDPRSDVNLPSYWEKFIVTLKLLRDYSETNHIKFFVSIIPMDVQVSKRYWDKYPWMPFSDEEFKAQRPQKRVKSIMDELHIDYLDLLPILQTTDKELELANDGRMLYFDNDPHFNWRWAKKVANWLYLYLLDKKYLE